MKQLLFISLMFLVLSCEEQTDNSSEDITETVIEDQSKENVDWLIGEWKRLNDDGESQTFENWEKESDQKYKGHGFVMQESDTVWQERMVLHANDSTWVLDVETPGNDDLVQFTMSELTSTSFTVENMHHDFPNTISYAKDGEKLSASITGAGGEEEVIFNFKRLK